MRRKLNRHKPFAEIYGNTEAKYEQDGIQFDEAGNELPGFEHVEIVEDVKVVTVSDPVLAAELERLKARVAELEEENETIDNLYEEEVSKTNKLEGEKRQLQERIAELEQEVAELKAVPATDAAAGSADEAGKAADAAGDGKTVAETTKQSGKGAGKSATDVDNQLSLQGKA